MPTGIIEMTILSRYACSSLNLVEKTPLTSRHTSRHSTTMVLSTVAAWSVRLKVRSSAAERSVLRISDASIRCPLLDTGRNSVSPCTMPRIIACRVVISQQKLKIVQRYEKKRKSKSGELSLSVLRFPFSVLLKNKRLGCPSLSVFLVD